MGWRCPRLEPSDVVGIGRGNAVTACPCAEHDGRIDDIGCPPDSTELPGVACPAVLERNDLGFICAEKSGEARGRAAAEPMTPPKTAAFGYPESVVSGSVRLSHHGTRTGSSNSPDAIAYEARLFFGDSVARESRTAWGANSFRNESEQRDGGVDV